MGSHLSFRSAEETGRNCTPLSCISSLIGNCMGKEEVEGRVRAKGIGRKERCALSFHQRFKGTKQDAQMENILLLFLSLFQSRLYFSLTRKNMPISSTMTHDELHLKIISFFFVSLSEVLTAF